MLSKHITDEICQKFDHLSPIFLVKNGAKGRKTKYFLFRLINVWQYWGNKWVVRKSEKIMQAKMKKMRGKVASMRKIEEKMKEEKKFGEKWQKSGGGEQSKGCGAGRLPCVLHRSQAALLPR